jgi:hypothetical protein
LNYGIILIDDNLTKEWFTMENKIQKFVKLLENDQLDKLRKMELDCDYNILGCKVSVKTKKKYTCVDVGTSGKYMVDNITGEIFAIKGYGKVDKFKKFGTLETIYQYYWGEYLGVKLKQERSEDTKLQSAESILSAKGIFIDENNKLYGGEYGEKQPPESPKLIKEFGNNRYEELTQDLKEARKRGVESIKDVEDSGTCNSDGIFLTLKGFREEKTIQAIKDSGLNGYKTKHSIYGTGFLVGYGFSVGQALRREMATETMYNYLKKLGYDIAHWQQMD